MNCLGLFLGIVSYTWLYHTFVGVRSVLRTIVRLCRISFYLVRIISMVCSMWIRNKAKPLPGSTHYTLIIILKLGKLSAVAPE